MTDIDALRHKLEVALRDRSVSAAAKALSFVSIDAEMKTVEQLDTLLKHVPRSNRKLLYAVGFVGGACLAVASLLWTVTLPTARIQIMATTESLAMRLREDQPLVWSDQSWDLGGGLFRLQDMSRIEVPPELYQQRVLEEPEPVREVSQELSKNISSFQRFWQWFTGGGPSLDAARLKVEDAWLEIKNTYSNKTKNSDNNTEMELTYFAAEPNTWLYFNRVALGVFEMRTADGAVLGELALTGAAAAEGGSSRADTMSFGPTQLDHPGIVVFSHRAIASQASVRFTPKDLLNLSDLRVRHLSFAKENTGPQTAFLSGLVSGSVTVLSTGETVKLESGSRLRLEGVNGVISRLTIGPEGSSFSFDGDVSSATIGPTDYERQLKPSLLEYLFHQQRLGFFWGSASFLWGLLWGARALLFK